jgi:hypothetical protein
MPISDPQITITSGVRQPKPAGRETLSIAAMPFPALKSDVKKLGPRPDHSESLAAPDQNGARLMHLHANPNRPDENIALCNAAMQIQRRLAGKFWLP